MADSTTKRAKLWPILSLVIPGVWGAVLIAAGILSIDEAWGVTALATGGAIAIVLLVTGLMKLWNGAICGAAAVTAAGLVAAGFLLGDMALVGPGVAALVIAGVAAPVIVMIERMTAGGAGAGFEQRLLDEMRTLHDHAMLSDNAKRVLFRERELDLLRRAIEEDLAHGEYDVALKLCDEMANVFGFREDAEAFRSRILEARQVEFDSRVLEALQHFERLLGERDWARVHQEAERIRRLFGESHLVADLDQRIIAARNEHKDELERQFLKAAEREDAESAMQLLRELDRYLSREEADRLAEVAHGVVVRHRENLGVQFKLACNDRRWAEAVRIGEVITDEFPNSKMADEVRSMIDVLRTRADTAATART